MLLRALLSLAVLIGWAPSPAPAGEVRTFIPQWIPQSQFAGYYMAQEKGFYRQNGLEIMIMRGGPEFPAGEMLARKRVSYATLFLSSALQLRDQGVKLLNIGQIVQRSGFLLVAKKAGGIRKPEDLQGTKVGIWPDFRFQPEAFFKKYGVTVQPVHQGASLALFLKGGVAACSAMWYNEYHNLLNSGLDEDELIPFFLERFGINFPEDGIYCLEETYRRDPEGARRFVQASLAGWDYAFAHREETLDVVMRHTREAHSGTNRVHQQWMLDKMKPLIHPEGQKTLPGALSEADYLRVAGELKRSGIIKAIPPYGTFYVDSLSRR